MPAQQLLRRELNILGDLAEQGWRDVPTTVKRDAGATSIGVLAGLQGGQVYVLDIATGAVLASIDGQGQRPNVSWISDGSGASSLVVSSENKLTAFKVTGPVQ